MTRQSKLAMAMCAAIVGGSGLMYVKERRTENAIAAVAAAPNALPNVPEPTRSPQATTSNQTHAVDAEIPFSPLPAPVTAAAVVDPSQSAPTEVTKSSSRAIEVPAQIGAATYVAKSGDTLSELAVALLGKDSKANRDALVAANPSLKANPDLVVIGQVYVASSEVVAPAGVAAAGITPPVGAPDREGPSGLAASQKTEIAPAKSADAVPELRYTAKPGDTVGNLSGALLGGETKTNRDAIVKANPSLQGDADHVVAGKTYRIPAPDGLSAATQPVATVVAQPATRPDADDIIHDASSRALRYTAKAGDTVTSLAIALLGSDTQANRDAIININASLKSDPDHIVVGQTYWIPAPAADVRLTR